MLPRARKMIQYAFYGVLASGLLSLLSFFTGERKNGNVASYFLSNTFVVPSASADIPLDNERDENGDEGGGGGDGCP